MSIDNHLVTRAVSAMKAGQYTDAAHLLERQTAAHPEDVGALLRLGLCHLLNRQEKLFILIHRRAAMIIRNAADLSEEVRGLFAQSETWFKKVTAVALVMGTMAAACSDPVPPYGLGEYQPTDPDDGGIVDTDSTK